ncbi:hypothetical protein Hanom_Chr03g00193681 [Helianthus anomalus]
MCFKALRQLCAPLFPCGFGGNFSQQGLEASLNSLPMNLECHCYLSLSGKKQCPLVGLLLPQALSIPPYLKDVFPLPET